jgi:hypothetical protein
MNRKKTILNLLAITVYLVVITLSFLDWNQKNKTERQFDQIESNIYKSLTATKTESSELIIVYCDSVSRFISANPIDLKVDLNCLDYSSLDSSRIAAFRTDFISKVQIINNEYRNQERTANRRMFLVLIISQILLFIIRQQIAKRFNIESINDLESQKER